MQSRCCAHRCWRSATHARLGLSFQAAAMIAIVISPLTKAATGSANANAAVAAHPIEEKASAKVARRDEVWRRRNWLRLACARNQNWIAVDDAAPRMTPPAVTAAWKLSPKRA